VSEATDIVLGWTPGRNGSGIGTLAVRRGDELLHTDKIDPARASARKRFVDDLCHKYPAVRRDDLERELLAVADNVNPS
jgi:hypothetical protein